MLFFRRQRYDVKNVNKGLKCKINRQNNLCLGIKITF